MSSHELAGGSVDQASCLRRSPDVASRIIDDDMVLLHGQTGASLSLNRTGGIVWDLLDGSPLGDLVDDIASATGAARPDVAARVLEVVRALAQGEFLTDAVPR